LFTPHSCTLAVYERDAGRNECAILFNRFPFPLFFFPSIRDGNETELIPDNLHPDVRDDIRGGSRGFARTIIGTEIKIEINAKSSFRQAGFS